MNTLPEAVNHQFSALFASLYHATDDLKIAGAEANLMGDFAQVTDINELCQQLQSLDAEVKVAISNFSSSPHSQRAKKSNSRKKNFSRTRTPSSRLRVKVSGETIEESTIAQTFLKSLRVLGFEQVAKLNKVVSKAPLVSRSPVHGYQSQKRCDGWYITTHVGKRTAIRVLGEISQQLNVAIKFESY